jgi:hypothetical protein
MQKKVIHDYFDEDYFRKVKRKYKRDQESSCHKHRRHQIVWLKRMILSTKASILWQQISTHNFEEQVDDNLEPSTCSFYSQLFTHN